MHKTLANQHSARQHPILPTRQERHQSHGKQFGSRYGETPTPELPLIQKVVALLSSGRARAPEKAAEPDPGNLSAATLPPAPSEVLVTPAELKFPIGKASAKNAPEKKRTPGSRQRKESNQPVISGDFSFIATVPDSANGVGMAPGSALIQEVIKSLPQSPAARHRDGNDLGTSIMPRTPGAAIVAVTPELPIAKHRSEIERAVMLSDYTLIVGETGSGKSLGTPEILEKLGYNVIVLEPRRVAASSLAERLSWIFGTDVGEEIGFRHGLDSSRSRDTKVLYSTFGSQYRAELANPSNEKTVIVFDEFHELSAEAELLLGLLRMRRELTGEGPKVVIMSATMDSERLAEFLGSTPIVHVSGRTFPIEHIRGSGSMPDDIVRVAADGKHSVCFYLGKQQIEDDREAVAAKGLPIDLIPFHSGLSAREIAPAFQPYQRSTAVLGTNAVQTSLTLPEMDVAILSGKVRRSTVDHHGFECLVIDEISRSEALQQMGRVGRTKLGQVISYAPPLEDLVMDVPAELQNIRLDGLFLRATAAGKDFYQINRYCYNPADKEQIREARMRLHELGLLGPRGHLTAAGDYAARVPAAPHLGKIIYSAEHEGDAHRRRIMERAIDIVAVAEGETFAKGTREAIFNIIGRSTASELTAQGALLEVAVRDGVEALEELTVDMNRLERAMATREKIRGDLSLKPGAPTISDRDELANRLLHSALCSGFIGSVFRYTHHDENSGKPMYRHIRHGGQWVLSKESMVDDSRFVIGRPLNIDFFRSDGEISTISLITMTSAVDTKWLKNNLPLQLRENLTGELRKEKNNEDRLKRKEAQEEFYRPGAYGGRGRR